MVLKQCHSRFRTNSLNPLDKRPSFTLHQDGVSIALSGIKVVTVNTSARLPSRSFSSFLNSSERPPLRWRRAPGPKLKDNFSALRQKAIRRELSTSAKALQYDQKPDVPKTEGRKLFFDTHAVVRLFEENGFSPRQAEVTVKLLLQTSNSNMDIIYSDMVTKVQQEVVLQQVMSKIQAVKKDMIILEKSEFSNLLTENERLKIHLLQLKVQLADVMSKVQSDNALDMNLEKSRVKTLKAEHEKKLLETRREIMEMAAEQDGRLTQTNMNIDTEEAGLKTMLESHKLDTIKYLAGSVFTCLTIVLGFYRLWM